MTETALWLAANESPVKSPRFVVEIAFDLAASDLHYFTSHSDAALPAGATVIHSVVTMASVVQQTLSPDNARAQIGNVSFGLRDKSGAISTLFASKFAAGESLVNRRVRVYRGYADTAWEDYQPVTQTITGAKLGYKSWRIDSADVQRDMKKDLFGDLVTTTLTADISDTVTTIPVTTTTKFAQRTVQHGASYSDLPNQTVVYFKIEDEVISCLSSNIQATQFVSVTRGALGTAATEHKLKNGGSADNAVKIEEYVYFEMPAVKAVYALMTGVLYSQAGTLPWNTGVDTSFINLDTFTGVGDDLWKPSDDTVGPLFRFEGVTKEDGKKFIEEQLLRPLGLFLRIAPDGRLEMQRIQVPLPGAGYETLLDEAAVVSLTDIELDYSSIKNWIWAKYNWDTREKKYSRDSVLLDADSINRHKISEKPVVLALRGVYGSRTSRAVLHDLMDYFRDSYAGPAWRATVECRYSHHRLKIGQLARLYLPNITDPYTGDPIDRVVRIDGASDNLVDGTVSFEVFGATEPATPLPATDVGDVLPVSFWTARGTNLAAVITITVDGGGVGHIASNATVNGGTDMTASNSIFYYDGELVVDAGVVLTLAGNVQMRVRYGLTVNGTITTKGGGLAGGAGATGVVSYSLNGRNHWSGNANPGSGGYLGASYPQLGLDYTGVYFTIIQAVQLPAVYARIGAYALPRFSVAYSPSSNDLIGLPPELRGIPGGGGGPVTSYTGSTYDARNYHAPGGSGGASGGGFILVAPGLWFGVNGKIITDGNDGSQGGSAVLVGHTIYGGAGDGGSPGGFLCLLSNTNAEPPDLSSTHFSAKLGALPVRGASQAIWHQNEYIDGMSGMVQNRAKIFDASGNIVEVETNPDLFAGAKRVQYVPEYIAPVADASKTVVQPPASLILYSDEPHLLTLADGTQVPRLYFLWGASPDVYKKGYQLQYKLDTDAAWTTITGYADRDATSEYATGFKEGQIVYGRIRTINRYNNESAWVQYGPHAIVGKTGFPSDVVTFTSTIASDGIELSWSEIPDIDRSEYEIRSGTTWATAVFVDRLSATKRKLPFQPVGNNSWLIKSIDSGGRYAFNATQVIQSISAPVAPSVTAQVVDNNVLIFWTEPLSSQPIKIYEIRRGNDFASATVVGTKSGLFTSVFETASGTYKYWVVAIDGAGNYGAAGSVTCVVNQPPDYVLLTNVNSTFSGTLNNMAPDTDGTYVLPVDTAETFQQHFTNNSWSTPQDQVNAGYPIFAQPGASSGYYEETYDYGATIPSTKVTLTVSGSVVSGSPVLSTTISVSANGSSWTDYPGVTEVYATGFRYIKYRVTVTASGGDDFYRISAINLKLDAKQKNDSGSGTAYTEVAKTFTADAATDVLTSTAHGFTDGKVVQFTTTGTLPGGLSLATDYFVINSATNTYKVSATPNGAAVDITSAGTGTHTATADKDGTAVFFNETFVDITSITVGVAFGGAAKYALYNFVDVPNPKYFKIPLYDASGTRVGGGFSWQSKGY